MNTTKVNETTFHTIIERSGAGCVGVDVGRTHGIHSYSRNGKYVGVHSWSGSGATRENYYEIATYLYEAYGE
jgi:hypothetical protein